MGISIGIQLGGTSATVANIARRAGEAAAAAALNELFRLLKESLRRYFAETQHAEAVTTDEHDVRTAVQKKAEDVAMQAAQDSAEAASELAAEAAANGVANCIIQINTIVESLERDYKINMEIEPKSDMEHTVRKIGIQVQNIEGHDEFKKFIKEFQMSAIFSEAANNKVFQSGLSNQKRFQLENYLQCLKQIELKLKTILEWLEKHQTDEVYLNDSVESLLLTNVIVPLIAGIGNLQRLAGDVDNLNKHSKPMAEAQIGSLKRGVDKVIKAFGKLSYYRLGRTPVVGDSNLFPIIMDSEETYQWESKLQY